MNLAAKLAASGEAATITVYPDAYHGFDGPSAQPRRRLEVPNGVNPGKGVTVAGNPAARDDAYAKLKKYLREHLGSGEAAVTPACPEATPGGISACPAQGMDGSGV